MNLELKKLNDRIYYLEHDDETDTPVLGYIKGEVFSLMVDAGTGPDHVEMYMSALEAAELTAPVFTVVTHHHWDHSFGMCALETISIACSQCAKKLERLESVEWTEDSLADCIKKGIIPKFCEEHIHMAYPDLSEIEVMMPDVIIDGEMTIDLGGCRAIINHIPSCHGNDCVVVYVPEEKVLFTGDGLCEGISGMNWVDDPEELKDLQKWLRALDFETCISGHSEPMTKNEVLGWIAERLQK